MSSLPQAPRPRLPLIPPAAAPAFGGPAGGPPAPARRRATVIDRASAPHYPVAEYARHAGPPDDGATGPLPPAARGGGPAGGPDAGAPLPPRPAGAWSRLSRRGDTDADPADAATVAQPAVDVPVPPADAEHHDHDAHAHDLHDDDQTGGLEVIGVDDDSPRGRRARRRAARAHDDSHDLHDDLHDDEHDHPAPRRRRRRPLAVVLSLLVLAGLVAGIFFGGSALLDLVNPEAEDYTGQGSGTVEVRVEDGASLRAIADALVEAGVIASAPPFIEAAEANSAAMGIQPGVYGMREQMSGAAALDRLLDPTSRLFVRVTIPEGFTVAAVLQRLAETTETPIEELVAASQDPAALGLPAYTNGLPEGFLFPATYDFEPDDTPTDMLRQMVVRSEQVLDELGVPDELRLTVVTKASLVQAEASSPEDMGMVAQVLENRLAMGMPLQLDTTVNYANGKSGITTTAADRANPSPYNTYYHPGLPPGAITNPGEDALRAVLNPTPGAWLFFVVVNPDTGETRFAVTPEEHQANVALFQQWLRENPD
ncbi:endolytic transglycosylase MltG [Blastococcus sp. SYSU D00820]